MSNDVKLMLALLQGGKRSRSTAAKHDLSGYGSILAAMKFMRWAIEQDRFPTTKAVQAHFNVCRATAYRWTLALAECYGVDPATRNAFDRPRVRATKFPRAA